MGWGRMLLLGDLGQQLDIRDTQAALQHLNQQLAAARQADHGAARSLEALARENAELKLYLAAVTRLLVAKGVVTPRELADIVDVIDRSDGQADGGFSGRIPPAG